MRAPIELLLKRAGTLRKGIPEASVSSPRCRGSTSAVPAVSPKGLRVHHLQVPGGSVDLNLNLARARWNEVPRLSTYDVANLGRSRRAGLEQLSPFFLRGLDLSRWITEAQLQI